MNTMRIVLYLVSSLTIAAVLLLFLVAAGVLQFKQGDTEIQRAAAHKQPVTVIADGSLNVAGTSEKEEATVQDSSAAAMAAVPAKPVESSNIDITDEIGDRAVDFLASHTGESGFDVEEKFLKFLLEDCQVEQADAAKLSRMSFWKNFVSLQKEWQAGEVDVLRAAFARELELKQAGFAAKGLTLMKGEIEAALTAFRDLELQLTANHAEDRK